MLNNFWNEEKILFILILEYIFFREKSYISQVLEVFCSRAPVSCSV